MEIDKCFGKFPCGGTRVTVRGAELGNANYRCVSADDMVEMESSADFLTNSEIACAVPVWPVKSAYFTAHIFLKTTFPENSIAHRALSPRTKSVA